MVPELGASVVLSAGDDGLEVFCLFCRGCDVRVLRGIYYFSIKSEPRFIILSRVLKAIPMEEEEYLQENTKATVFSQKNPVTHANSLV